MRKLFAAALVAASLAACTSSAPCDDAGCPNIGGYYSASWDLDAGTLEKTGDGGVCTWVIFSGWSLTQTGSALALESGLLPMTGTLYSNNTVALSGESGGLNASMSGSVTPGATDGDGGVLSPASMRGQLVSNSIDADGNTCLSIVAFEATQL